MHVISVLHYYTYRFNSTFGLQQRQGCSEHIQLGEYIDPELLVKFEKETGIRVNQDLFETNEHMLAKLEGGGSYYDVIFPSDYVIEEMIKKDMLQK